MATRYARFNPETIRYKTNIGIQFRHERAKDVHSHECIDDIRRKSFIAVKEIETKDCLKPQFQRNVESSFKAAEPFMRFLCEAVGVRF